MKNGFGTTSETRVRFGSDSHRFGSRFGSQKWSKNQKKMSGKQHRKKDGKKSQNEKNSSQSHLKVLSSFLGPAVSRRPAEGGGEVNSHPRSGTFTVEHCLRRCATSVRSAADCNRSARSPYPKRSRRFCPKVAGQLRTPPSRASTLKCKQRRLIMGKCFRGHRIKARRMVEFS